MVRFRILRLLRLTIGVGAAIVSLGSCSDSGAGGTDPAPGCDAFSGVDLSLIGHTNVFAANPTTNLSNGLRTYSWTKDATNLCVAAPESGNNVDFEVDVEPGAPALTVTGKAYAAALVQPYSTAMTLETAAGLYAYRGSVTGIGLAQGSGDGLHGAVTMVLSITFASQGSDGADLSFVQTFVDNVTIHGSFQTLK